MMFSEHMPVDLVEVFSHLYRWEVGLVLVVITVIISYSSRSPLPLINARRPFELSTYPARKRFVSNAPRLIRAGFEQAPVFRILTDSGYRTVLSPRYANEIKNLGCLSAAQGTAEDFQARIPGFEPFRETTADHGIIQEVARTKISRSLDWHNVAVQASILGIVAQMSSRVFLGEPLCRNPDWLRVSVAYAEESLLAISALNVWPRFLRPAVAPFLPECRTLRQTLRQAREIIGPTLESRQAEKESFQGKTPPEHYDAIEWLEQCAQGRAYDPVHAQVLLSFATVHITGNLLSEVLCFLIRDQDLIRALRHEVITAVRAGGWTKAMLQNLKLVDSTIKETQRLRNTVMLTMSRLAMADVRLSDGTRIAKGSLLLVSTHSMSDPDVYENPEAFDAYRFLKLRESASGYKASYQLATPSPEHLAFGLGPHSCPGRFFAADLMKIALCHILLRYDIRAVEGSPTQPVVFGITRIANPEGQIAIRRREEEVDM